ncbi:MAG: metal-dependent hydrolase [Deltaproteobacteria bacterium]|nr:metal-dependent hydrolase [Deltaproteobacteria bacterium]
MTLQITREGKVVIRTPLRTPNSEIERFFHSRQVWIAKKINGKEIQEEWSVQPREFMAGDEFFYLGDPYPLELAESNGTRKALILSRGKFLLAREKASQAKELFVKWYRERAREVFGERVYFWSSRFSLTPTGVTITSSWQRYGSCSAKNSLSFSWRLLMAPYPVIDYIIVHELAHIKEKNHSKKFWQYLESLMPDYETQKRWLRENSHLLRL